MKLRRTLPRCNHLSNSLGEYVGDDVNSLNIPYFILVIPDIGDRQFFSAILFLCDSKSIPKERKYVSRIFVLDFEMLVPRVLQEFQMMQQAAGPNIYPTVWFIVLSRSEKVTG